MGKGITRVIHGLSLCLVACAPFIAPPAHATTKGLSQIVTPDLQPVGQLSLSLQAQASKIGNPYELQAELGLTKWIEVAAFQGFSPNEQVLGTEIGLINHGPYLLTTGFINWSTNGVSPQPLLEGGYYTVHEKYMAGAVRVGNHEEALLGWAHDFNPTWRFQLDHQSGKENFFTVGFPWNITHSWQVNPAMYLSNDHTHAVVGYVVFTYTFPLW